MGGQAGKHDRFTPCGEIDRDVGTLAARYHPEGPVPHSGRSSPGEEVQPSLSQSIWAEDFGEPGLFPGPKEKDVYREPSVST